MARKSWINAFKYHSPIEGDWWRKCLINGGKATVGTYQKGCRCGECKEMWRLYCRKEIPLRFPKLRIKIDESQPILTIEEYKASLRDSTPPGA